MPATMSGDGDAAPVPVPVLVSDGASTLPGPFFFLAIFPQLVLLPLNAAV